MKKRRLWIGLGLIAAFALWTLAVTWVDVQTIGPQESCIGLATLNRFVHSMTGVHMGLYVITDWLGLVPVGTVLGFTVLGFVQWVKRGHIQKVDTDLIVLGAFYVVVMAAYLLFEVWVVNYRPVLIHGTLEASYPSSTTLLVMTVMPTAMLQLHRRIQHKRVRQVIVVAMALFVLFMVVGRLLAGVHWMSDIIGGALLSGGLVLLYQAATE